MTEQKIQKDFENNYFKNLDYFKKFHSDVYNKLKNFEQKEQYSLVLKNYQNQKIPNIEIQETGQVAYQDNPQEYSEQLANNAIINTPWLNITNEDKSSIKNIDKAIFISNGLGLHFKYFNKLYNIKSILIIENNLELFKLSCFVVDYQKLSIHKKISFSISDEDDILENKILQFFHSLFFYNKSLKLIQIFQNDTFQRTINILQNNINHSFIKENNINYDNSLLNTKLIKNDNECNKEQERLIHLINSNKIPTTNDIETAIRVIAFLNTQLSVSTKNDFNLHQLYYILFHFSSMITNGIESIKYYSYQYLVEIEKQNLLPRKLFKNIISVSYSKDNYDSCKYFQEKFVNYLKRHEASADIEKQQLSYEIYKLQALQKENLTKSSKEYIITEFDNFAEYFEDKLTNDLEYKIPEILTNNIMKYLNNKQKYNILDIGCGTGLLGIELKSISNQMIGIDLSKKMLHKAQEKNIYTELHNIEIQEYLDKQPKLTLDIIVSADVFIYIGELYEIFRKASDILVNNGIFAFSIEVLKENKNYNLNESGRFSHSEQYIIDLAHQYNFQILNSFHTTIRKENDIYLPGMIFILTAKAN